MLLDDVARAGGNPFLAIELVTSHSAAGSLTTTTEGLVELEAGHLAEDLGETVLRRLDQLRPETVEFLRAASVLGRTFAVSVVATLLGRRAIEVVPDVDEALAAGVPPIFFRSETLLDLDQLERFDEHLDRGRRYDRDALPDVAHGVARRAVEWLRQEPPQRWGFLLGLCDRDPQGAGRGDRWLYLGATRAVARESRRSHTALRVDAGRRVGRRERVMTYHFALSPDVNVRDLSHWFVFNTRLQKRTGAKFHLSPFDDFAELERTIASDGIDLIYANAADTAVLVRQRGFVPLVRARGVADEALIAVAEESPWRSLKDLRGDSLVAAATNAPDVERICRILLEPVDFGKEAIQVLYRRNPVMVTKSLLLGEAKVGFFLATAFEEMSATVKNMLRPLAKSRVHLVRHSMLASPRMVALRETLRDAFLELSSSHEDHSLLVGLGAPQGWVEMSSEEADLMIDLMDTLDS